MITWEKPVLQKTGPDWFSPYLRWIRTGPGWSWSGPPKKGPKDQTGLDFKTLLKMAMFHEAVKMGKHVLRAKYLHHACYVAAGLFLFCVKFSDIM